MAYNNARLSMIPSGTIEGQGPNFWVYLTADSLATVMGAAYLSDAKKFGMRIGDMILVVIGTLNTAVYPSSGAATADVGEAADFTAVPQWCWTQVVSFTGDGANLAGAKQTIGGAATDLVGFYGTTPIVQPAATAQSSFASTTITTAATTTITTVGSTSLTALDVTRINAAFARIEEIRVWADGMTTRVEAMRVYLAQARTDLLALGLEKGSA